MLHAWADSEGIGDSGSRAPPWKFTSGYKFPYKYWNGPSARSNSTLVNVYVDLLVFTHAHGYLCKHLGIDSSTDPNDRYSNLFLNAYINRHAHTEYVTL